MRRQVVNASGVFLEPSLTGVVDYGGAYAAKVRWARDGVWARLWRGAPGPLRHVAVQDSGLVLRVLSVLAPEKCVPVCVCGHVLAMPP